MSVPTAVSPSNLVPGVYMTMDLTSGTSSPSTGVLRVALLATQSSSGDLTNDTEVRTGTGAESASTAFGPGTIGHLAAKQIYSKYGSSQVDFISPAPGSGSATLDVTAANSPTSDVVVDCDIHGVEFEVEWLSGEAADDFKTRAIDAINEKDDDLFVTASSGGTGIITITAKVAGNIGNDVKVKMKLRKQSGTETVTGAATHTALSGGSTDGSIATALSNLAGKEYHIILACLSNTDVANVSTANNVSRLVTHVDAYNTGLEPKFQQFVVGYTGTVTLAAASAPHSNSAGNSEKGEMILCIGGRGLPGVLGARETGGRIAAESLDPAANRINEILDGYVGSHDIVADKPTTSEAETALGAGVSLVGYTAQDAAKLVRAVTTHSQNAAGGSDTRLLDVQNVSGAYIVARDLRDNIALEFPNAKIQEDSEPGADPPPKGVIEERDIKSWIISRLRYWERQGVVQKAFLDEAISDGSLAVEVNESDPTQVDCVVPFKIVQPLAKFGIVGQRVPG